MVEADSEPRWWLVLTASWCPRFAIELLFDNSTLHKPTPQCLLVCGQVWESEGS